MGIGLLGMILNLPFILPIHLPFFSIFVEVFDVVQIA